tara:strand:+ start:2019 stop:2345 length:327 start_codon:yes stop_codon:yes gene_type:complete
MDLINIGIIITYIMIFGAALTAIVFSLINMSKNKKNAKKTIYASCVLILVILIAYFISSSEVLPSYTKYEIDSGTSKRVGMGLNTFYLLAIGAFMTVLYTEFGKVFKK